MAAGFEIAGAVNLPHPDTDLDAARFEQFIGASHVGEMRYLAKRNEQGRLIRANAQIPFAWARSAVVCLATYHADAPLSTGAAPQGSGWIARYAWSGKIDASEQVVPADYHKFLLKRLKALESSLHAAYGEFECRTYVDTGPVMERSLARAAGLGWTGKNTCLIHPKLGSWTFLAVLLTSLEVKPDSPPLIIPDRCGSCTRCIDACPTDALKYPYQMDATRCISYLTIEHPGEITEDLRAKMGRQIFGCDICQDVCPWNRKAPIAANVDVVVRKELINPALDGLADLDFAAFERLFNGSPVRRAGFAGFRRNLAIAMGNSGLERFKPWLERWAEKEETQTGESEKSSSNRSALQSIAVWALERLKLASGKQSQVELRKQAV